MSERSSSGDLSRVIKVGGSLFADPCLPQQFVSWLKDQPPACCLVLTGGGRLADEIRELDQRFGLPAHVSHDLAIRTMRAQAKVLLTLLDAAGCRCEWLNDLEDGPRSPGVYFIDPVRFMEQDAQSASPLLASWHVTSDSIAARVATVASVHELVLLKSRTPTVGKNLQALSAEGYVDPEFEGVVWPWLEGGGRLTFATVSQYS